MKQEERYRYSPEWWRRFTAPLGKEEVNEDQRNTNELQVHPQRLQRSRRRRRRESKEMQRSQSSKGTKFSLGGARFPEPKGFQVSASVSVLGPNFSSIGKQSLSTHLSSQGFSLGHGRRSRQKHGGSAGPAFSGASAFGKQQLSRTRTAAAFDFSSQAGRADGASSQMVQTSASPGPIYDPVHPTSSRQCGIGIRFPTAGGRAASADGMYGAHGT